MGEVLVVVGMLLVVAVEEDDAEEEDMFSSWSTSSELLCATLDALPGGQEVVLVVLFPHVLLPRGAPPCNNIHCSC